MRARQMLRAAAVLLTCLYAAVVTCCAGAWLHAGAYASRCRAQAPPSPVAASVARVLVAADPQMEGSDRSRSEGWYGAFNNWLNDAMAAFVVSRMQHAFSPSHAAVLGDLFSRQDIGDDEFAARLQRYRRVFGGLPHLLNISGNHDLGYGDDITTERVARFETALGYDARSRTHAHAHHTHSVPRCLNSRSQPTLATSLETSGLSNLCERSSERIERKERKKAAGI